MTSSFASVAVRCSWLSAGGPLGADHAFANLRELGDMLLVARLDLLQLALDFGEPLGGLFRLADTLGELSGLSPSSAPSPRGRRPRRVSVRRSLVGGVDALRQRSGLPCRCQADGAKE